jgi:hypothetical protein
VLGIGTVSRGQVGYYTWQVAAAVLAVFGSLTVRAARRGQGGLARGDGVRAAGYYQREEEAPTGGPAGASSRRPAENVRSRASV